MPHLESKAPTPQLEIGANLGSFLPWVMANQVAGITTRLKQEGFDFVSLLPMRNTDRPSALPVWFLERAWNPTPRAGIGGLLDVLQGGMRHDPQAPHLQDWIAFPDADTAQKLFEKQMAQYGGQAHIVKHRLDDSYFSHNVRLRSLLEVNPGMTESRDGSVAPLTLDRLVEHLERARESLATGQPPEFDGWNRDQLSGVVFDTNHTRRSIREDEVPRISRPGMPTRENLGGYKRVLEALAPHIRLIDFQGLNPEELRATLSNQSTVLADMIGELMERLPGVPIRLEIQLSPVEHLVPGAVMTQMLEAADFVRGVHGQIYPENSA